MKYILLPIICLPFIGLSSAYAETSANISIATDYVYRGISQTSENPAIQGGFDINSESGLYAGVWASNVAFDGSIEIDLYAGYGGNITEDVEFDIGILRYEYPEDAQGGAPDSSFNEVYASVAFKGLTFGFAYTPEFFAESDQATYIHAEYDIALSNDLSLNLHFGRQAISDNNAFGTPDYTDYSIGLSKSFNQIDFSLTAYDTNLSNRECFGGGSDCEARVVLAVSKSL